LTQQRLAKLAGLARQTVQQAKGQKERKVPVPRSVLEVLSVYREAFGMTTLPDPTETTALLLSARTSRVATISSGGIIRDVPPRRGFQAWRPVTTRHGLCLRMKTNALALDMVFGSN
jgi:site-specific recombinase XerD